MTPADLLTMIAVVLMFAGGTPMRPRAYRATATILEARARTLDDAL